MAVYQDGSECFRGNTVECTGLGGCAKCGHLTSLWQGELRPEERMRMRAPQRPE